MKPHHTSALVLMLGLAVLGTSCAAQTSPAARETSPDAAPAAPKDAPAEPARSGTGVDAAEDVSTNELLDRMHTLGQTLTSLRANVEMQTTDDITGDDSSRTGSFLLHKRGEGDTRARVKFDKLIIDDAGQKKTILEKIEYLLEGDWVVDRVYGRSANDPGGRRETHRQIRKPGEKVDLLKLGEGPFPLPIGQPRDSVRAQFEVTRLPDDAEKPGLVGLELRPREETRLARRFHQIVLWIDPADAMPRIIETVNAEIQTRPDPANPGRSIAELAPGTESKRTTLRDVQINQPVTDDDFKLDPIDESNWTIVREEYRE